MNTLLNWAIRGAPLAAAGIALLVLLTGSAIIRVKIDNPFPCDIGTLSNQPLSISLPLH